MPSEIPTFGATNGTIGTSEAINPSVAVVCAVMYNYYDSSLINDNSSPLITNSSNRVVLNPYVYKDTFTLDNFLNLFYPTNAGYFNVNLSNVNNSSINLSSQKWTSSNSSSNHFSLSQFLLRAYSTNKGVNVNDIDPRVKILLEKETFYVQSLASIKGTTISLSWDEVIISLLNSGNIIKSSGLHAGEKYATVPLGIILNFHSFVLDIDLSIQLVYNVEIDGYVNPASPAAQP
jgi:hypothetical protein